MSNPIVKNAILLALFALICTLFVVLTNQLTEPQIIAQQKQKLSHSLQQVLPSQYVNQDLLKSCREIRYPHYLGNNYWHKIWIAKQGQTVKGIAYQTTAPDGYNGPIRLLVGVMANGEVFGVRVISENETPGLGDQIELRKSNWILSFAHQKLLNANDKRWAVKKDGGMFDQFTGATITPRAVVKAVKRTLELNRLKFDDIIASQRHCGDNS